MFLFNVQKSQSKVQVFVDPPSPDMGNSLRVQRINEIRRHSSHSPSLTVKEYDAEKDRRHSGVNPNELGLDSEHMRFLNCSPAASRRISCGSLFKPNEPLGSSKSSLFAGSTSNFKRDKEKGKDDTGAKEKTEKTKKLPIINPLVRSPHWPSESNFHLIVFYFINFITLFSSFSTSNDKLTTTKNSTIISPLFFIRHNKWDWFYIKMFISQCRYTVRCC